MTEERWVRIQGLDADYSVSDHGRVRNNNSGYILSDKRRNPHGYVHHRLLSAGKQREFLAHRLVALYFIGEPTGPSVRHLDDVKHNNHVSNLAYGTQAENMQDAIRNGTVGVGVRKRISRCRRGGHEMTPENTYVYGSRPYVGCNTCRLEKVRARNGREKEERAARRAS
jgi:hypothetical protein